MQASPLSTQPFFSYSAANELRFGFGKPVDHFHAAVNNPFPMLASAPAMTSDATKAFNPVVA